MQSIGIETGSWARGRELDLMRAVSEATFAPLSVKAEKSDVVVNCRDEEERLIPPGRSDRLCRIEIKMIVGRSDDQERALRASICRSLASFGVSDPDVKVVVTEARRPISDETDRNREVPPVRR